jgi:hypothetical protein
MVILQNGRNIRRRCLGKKMAVFQSQLISLQAMTIAFDIDWMELAGKMIGRRMVMSPTLYEHKIQSSGYENLTI